MTVNQGNVGCQNCEYREEYKNQLICQHKASMEGIEAYKEFYLMNEVKECDYYSCQSQRKDENNL